MFMPVFRNMAHAGSDSSSDGHVCNILSIHCDRSFLYRFQPGKAIYQLRLAISVNSRDTDDLTSSDIKGYMIHRIVLVLF